MQTVNRPPAHIRGCYPFEVPEVYYFIRAAIARHLPTGYCFANTWSKLAHYKILKKIGQGGMGEVYLAEDSKLGREVAIKVLPDAFAGDGDRRARFEREARVLASLNHPVGGRA